MNTTGGKITSARLTQDVPSRVTKLPGPQKEHDELPANQKKETSRLKTATSLAHFEVLYQPKLPNNLRGVLVVVEGELSPGRHWCVLHCFPEQKSVKALGL